MIRIAGQDITIDRARWRIEHAGASMSFGPVRRHPRPKLYPFRLVCALLLAGPRTAVELFDLVYGDRRDGGPLGGYMLIDVMLSKLKSRLAGIGLELRSTSGYPKRYWAAAVSAASRQVSTPASEQPRQAARECVAA